MSHTKKLTCYSWELSILSSCYCSVCCKKALNQKLYFDYMNKKRLCKSEDEVFSEGNSF
jgi:hypothetical protein